MTDLIPDKNLGSISRIICFITGLALASYLFLYSFHYEDFPHIITVIGYNLTTGIIIALMVLLTLISGWLVKIGITGRTGF